MNLGFLSKHIPTLPCSSNYKKFGVDIGILDTNVIKFQSRGSKKIPLSNETRRYMNTFVGQLIRIGQLSFVSFTFHALKF